MAERERERVTVCLPVYNGAPYIRQAVESVFAQDGVEWRLIISDNASDDGTWEMLKELKHPRLVLERQSKNIGVVANWNFLLERAEGEFVCFLGADDFFYREHLRRKVELLGKFPEAPFAHGPVDLVDETGKVFQKGEAGKDGGRFEPAKEGLRRLLEVNYINITSVVFRRGALAGRRFDERLRFFIDWNLYVELMLKFPGAVCDEAVTAAYRVHAASDARQNVRSARWALESRKFLLASFKEDPEAWARLGFDCGAESRDRTADLWTLAFQQWRKGNREEAGEAWRLFREFHGVGAVVSGLGPWLGRVVGGRKGSGVI